MKGYYLFRFDLSKKREYERVICSAKYFFVPTPRSGVYFSFTNGGHKIDLSRVSEIYVAGGVREFYISNEPSEGEFLIYAVNCGMEFEDVYTYEELRELIKEITEKWRDLLES